jgi:hypothetical protein
MNKEVYLLCKECNGITNGVGSGDPEDFIECSSCGRKMIRANIFGYLSPLGLEKRPLYVEQDKFELLVEE